MGIYRGCSVKLLRTDTPKICVINSHLGTPTQVRFILYYLYQTVNGAITIYLFRGVTPRPPLSAVAISC